MKLKIITVAVFFLFMSNMAVAVDQKPASEESIIVKQELEVIQINHEERWALLKDRSGFTKKFNISDDVRNLDNVAVGDVVYVNYAETMQIMAFGPDAINAGKEVEGIFARAPEGGKPGKAIATAATVVVTIAAIDLKNSLVTLKDKQGNTKTFKPHLPANLKKVKIGDKVAVSFAKAISITVREGKK